MTVVCTSSPGRMEVAKVCVVCSLLYPILLVVILAGRLKARFVDGVGEKPLLARSALTEAGEKLSLAISYALTAS
jgi:hypothetical protein